MFKSRRPRAVDDLVAGRLVEKAVERLALLVVEAAEHLVLDEYVGSRQ